jgi:hypothetical protein
MALARTLALRSALVSLALALTIARAHADSAYKEPSGKTRAAILDAIRPEVEAAYQMKLKFVVRRLKTNGQLAIALLVPTSLAGKRIDDSVFDAQHVDGLVHAILKHEDGAWRVIQRALSDGDEKVDGWEAAYPGIPKNELCAQCVVTTPSQVPAANAPPSIVGRPELVALATPPASEQTLTLDAVVELLIDKKLERRSPEDRAKRFAGAGPFTLVRKQYKTSGDLSFESERPLYAVSLEYHVASDGSLSFTGMGADFPVQSAVEATALHRKINQRLAKRLSLLYSNSNPNRPDDTSYELNDTWQLDLEVQKSHGQRRVVLSTRLRDPEGF